MEQILRDLLPEMQKLQSFEITFDNPVFTILILSTFLILAKLWGVKKSFSYCLAVSVILYFASKAAMNTNIPLNSSGFSVADLIKLFTFFLIALISIYYAMIKN
ncbi:MAG: hypothetical protein FJZ15_03850 [Candidatus Omnitrophica bacterium]|nr:hypothetical protein [Candidatus Omnitrophota bacterium]